MESKAEIRTRVLAARRQQAEPEQASSIIAGKLTELPEWKSAGTILFYVDVRGEVRTKPLLQQELVRPGRCVVPYCDGDRLQLVQIRRFEELTRGSFGVLEPCEDVRASPDRQVSPDQIDLAVIPGVAFDTAGGRLGYGRGYYDRLLPDLRADCPRIGLAFECQLVDSIPIEAHDHRVQMIVTERRVLSIR
ncbi:5-formyltetrahydrofolate cyclo-ligase [Planctomicrobium sp. SH661]|uniref:5-formyltetrahydrofolate cyclo-ligase n=1 Tax=Planctomicrobium sp. SH661 TaxID=3448124 RepID=UPI003F5AF003